MQKTLQRLDRIAPKGTPTSRPSVLRLDLLVNAPNKIFVRGRGLDAELGGSVRLRGPVTSISPLGQFELIRGRLSIVGQRLDLSRASIALEGDLDPVLDFLATTQSNDVQASIRLYGKASDLKLSLTSAPELAEDEILSQIIFNRELATLSEQARENPQAAANVLAAWLGVEPKSLAEDDGDEGEEESGEVTNAGDEIEDAPPAAAA